VEYYIKITQKKVTTRVVGGSHAHAAILRDKFTDCATFAGLVVDPRVYDTSGVLVRSASEVRAAMRLLNLIL
jgi:hypothetical protein